MRVLKDSIYSLADFLSFGKGISRRINGFKIFFPAKWSRYFESDYEKENVAFLKEYCKINDVVIDVGAHLGLISVSAAMLTGRGGKIYAFEPTPATFNILKQVVSLNGFGETIICIQNAVSNKAGETEFFINPQEGSNANSLVEEARPGRHTVKINVTSIDEFVKENSLTHLGILKIDAEGSELQVLEGALETLKLLRPRIILAIHPALILKNKNTLTEIYDLIKQLDYEIIYRKESLDKSGFCTKTDFFDVHLFPSR